MTSASSSPFSFYVQQVAIYVGWPIFGAGLVGETLNIIVFLSLYTFRNNSCVFYLLVMSCVNIGQLLTGVMIRILISGYGIDWTVESVFYCRFRQYCRQVCTLVSLTCFCLATIDQYLATCARPRWQQWCNIKLARRLCIATILLWVTHGIPCLLYFDIIRSTATGRLACVIVNSTFSQYYTYMYTAVLTGYLPVSICAFFGSWAYRNVRQLAYRTVPLVRRELDKQLTVMVLILDIYNILALLPYPVTLLITSVTTITQNPIVAAQISFVSDLTTYTYYSYFACPFYVYVLTSERFRRQFFHVLSRTRTDYWRRRQTIVPLPLPVP